MLSLSITMLDRGVRLTMKRDVNMKMTARKLEMPSPINVHVNYD